MKSYMLFSLGVLFYLVSCNSSPQKEETAETSKFKHDPLVTHIYTADPSAHVFDGKIYYLPFP
jgi:hypothetical protein